MKERLAFAIASQSKPDIILADEVFLVGDADFRSKCAEWYENCKSSTILILVTHFPFLAKKHCDQILILNHGEILYQGTEIDRGIEVYSDVEGGDDEDGGDY